MRRALENCLVGLAFLIGAAVGFLEGFVLRDFSKEMIELVERERALKKRLAAKK